MPEWSGGPCPGCQEWMPPSMVRCRVCRTLLNEDLNVDSVEVPSFVPLQEVAAVFDVIPDGFYCDCPDCGQELKIHRKYIGTKVACKHCQFGFPLDADHPRIRNATSYAKCPACRENLRFAAKYVGAQVACKFCGGHLKIHPYL